MRPYLRAANVTWAGLALADVKEMDFTAKESVSYELRPGDLLLSEASGSPMEVGKPAQYRGEIDGCCFQNTLIRVRLPEDLSPDFYEWYFRQQALTGRFAENSRGVGINHLGAKELAGWLIPVPSRSEQARIVARVEELMQLCDELEACQRARHHVTARLLASSLDTLTSAETPDDLHSAWSRVRASWEALTDRPDSIAKLRSAILHLAARGKLVPQSEADEPAAVFLRELHQERLRRVGTARPRRGIAGAGEMSGEQPYHLPSGWQWTTFAAASINRDSERVPVERSVRSQRQGPYDYYGASGVIDTIDHFLYDGDLLLIGEDGANLALRSTPIAFMATGRFWVNNHAHVIDSLSADALRYLAICVNSIDLKPFLTGIAQPKLNQRRMNEIPVPIPPAAEQARIVAKVDELMKLCDDLEACVLQRQAAHEAAAASIIAHVTCTDYADLAQ